MENKDLFYPGEILLPQEGTDMEKWAVLACDQHTSQPGYWQEAAAAAKGGPSTLDIILPEVYLEQAGVAQRIEKAHAHMEEYRRDVLTRRVRGFIYVERMLEGAVRQGLVGCVDLEDYSFEKAANARIRPSENTVVERIPPRLALRRGAQLESPHILMLIDDAAGTVIEPLEKEKDGLELLYDTPLMQGGGRIRGWAVREEALIRRICRNILALEGKEAFRARYGAGAGEPFAMAVGDGNHSLATAKAWWDEIKKGLTPPQQQGHPARYCLVELENIQSPGIAIEPIHRLVFGVDMEDFHREFQAFLNKNNTGPGPAQEFILTSGSQSRALRGERPPWPIAVGTLEAFLDEYTKATPSVKVDYVHGEDEVRKLSGNGNTGVLLPPFEKGDLFRGVALGGVLPKKTFSMGHAHEKRYYLECRAIV